jgi:hypothetical protein
MRLITPILVVALSAGCATNVIKPGEKPVAPAGEGLGALSVQTETYTHAVTFATLDLVDTIVVPHSSIGTSVHLFHARPGRYCLYQVHTANILYTFPLPPAQPEFQCLDVVAGGSKYFGRFVITEEREFVRQSAASGDIAQLEARFGPLKLAR